MRTILIGIFVALAISPALAQQDPDDPGLPDSIIIGSAQVDSSPSFQYVPIPLIAVTDDSVIFYYISLHWDAPRGGVGLGIGTLYFYPLTQWDEHYDTILASDSCVESMGWADTSPDSIRNPPLITDYVRWLIMMYRFIIAPNAPRQVVTLDSCQTNWFGIDSVAFVPRFQPGYIIIGPEVGIDDENPIPASFSLAQNYPNPFNAQTTISYTLPQKGPVTLSVYNLLGQRVATLFDGVQHAGEHKVVWDAAGAPSGAYFAKIEVAEKRQILKMVLLK